MTPISYPDCESSPGVWHNRLFHCDNMLAMDALERMLPEKREENASSDIRLIYIDPPFAVGTDFYAQVPLAGGTWESPEKERVFAYSDIWEEGISGYLAMLRPRIARMRELLTPGGCLCVHCDWRTTHHIRLLLDTCFGPKNFLNEIIWHYTGGGRSHSRFSRKHDTLLLYTKGSGHLFNAGAVRLPYKPTSGYAKNGIVSRAGKRYLPHPEGTPPDDVWDIPIINPMAAERLGYATQKPEALLERLILSLTQPGDLVADFFCGSGTTPAVAQRLGRRWVACDSGEVAIRITSSRLGEDSFVLSTGE